jgi:hypothetical protein
MPQAVAHREDHHMTVSSYHLSFAHSEQIQDFPDARSAGRAFAAADGALGPHVVLVKNNAARTIARSMRTDAGLVKAALRLEAALADPQNLDKDFWRGFHEVALPQAA